MQNEVQERFMERCLELAALGFGDVKPNPMVGCVIEKDGVIVAEGHHKKYGGAHAEVEALSTCREKSLESATLYVNLEPCNHTGKTPPCTESILKSGIKKVVIGSVDPNPLVAGAGIGKLKENGVEVISGVLEQKSRELNKRFFTFHETKRPYVILKWAETHDHFIARKDFSSRWISNDESRQLVHRWRAQEMAIMVGTVTAIHDNPHLTARIKGATNPVRVVIDRELKIPTSFHIFDESAKTLLFNQMEDYEYSAATLIKIDFSTNILPQILCALYERGLQSVLVEGGAKTMQAFIEQELWNEARVFQSPLTFGEGIPAPRLNSSVSAAQVSYVGKDVLSIYFRESGTHHR